MEAFSQDIALTPMSDVSQEKNVSYFQSTKEPVGDFAALKVAHDHRRHKFKSYRLRGAFDTPWKDDPRLKKIGVGNWIIRVCIILGFGLSAYINYFNYAGVAKHDYCLVFEDNFQKLDGDVWTHLVQIDGFGTGSFDWTTTDPKNSYVDAEGLHIIPTLTNMTTNYTSESIFHGDNLNLTEAGGGDGSCTSTAVVSCAIRSNSTEGTMIPPVRSARLVTKGKKSIKYGRVEVTAKMPTGDWLWPAIWMMPEESIYGEWPRSGEIDITEVRGNGYEYPEGGKDWMTSTLHWGPSYAANAFWRTTAGRHLRRSDFTKEFNTFGLEWTEDYIFTYLNSRLVQTLYTGFKKDKDLWELGGFSKLSENKSLYDNPWINTTAHNAPFDQSFYLILNVAVGSRNGWFLDKVGNKSWLDQGASAQWDFYREVDSWYPTWGEGDKRGMTVQSVKMWQQGKCS